VFLNSATRFAFDVPTLSLPGRLPEPAVLFLAMLLLASLDLVGAILAKSWSEQRTFPWFAAGATVFVLLFWVYGSVLKVAELSIVTLGWIVILQVAVVILDRVRYSVPVSPGQFSAIVAILVLQGYLVLSASSSPDLISPPPDASIAAASPSPERSTP
jgi:hypothetical protein